jgi:hypothetical protein
MSEQQAPPELAAAIKKGMIIDGVALAAGGALWLATDNVAWFVGFFIAGSVAFTLLLAQAGAFTRRDGQS